MLLQFRPEKGLEKVPHTLVECGVYVIMPLLEPRQQFRESSQQWFQPLNRPAFLLDHLGVVARQGLGMLEMVPAGPVASPATPVFPALSRVPDSSDVCIQAVR